MKFRVYGSGDDLIELDGDINEEYGAGTYRGDQTVAGRLVFTEYDGTEVLEILPVYYGFWAFAVGPGIGLNNEEWPADIVVERSWGNDVPYSETLSIEIPDNVKVTWQKA